MNTQKLILFFLIGICFLSKNANSQTYSIESFQGLKTSIVLYYKPFSGRLRITALHDTLWIEDFIVVDTVKISGKRFLEINYIKRAGSNQGRGNTLLLCVNNGKLCQSMHVLSFS